MTVSPTARHRPLRPDLRPRDVHHPQHSGSSESAAAVRPGALPGGAPRGLGEGVGVGGGMRSRWPLEHAGILLGGRVGELGPCWITSESVASLPDRTEDEVEAGWSRHENTCSFAVPYKAPC